MTRTLLADPPWRYSDKLRMSSVRRSSDDQYPTMSVEEIKGFVIPETLSDAFLFLWTTNSMLLDGEAGAVCRAWGFRLKQLITWVKGDLITRTKPGIKNRDLYISDIEARLNYRIGLGHYTRGTTEHMVLAVKGSPKWLVKSRSIPNIIVAYPGRHSVKPEESYQLIEALVPGPYTELFARRRREGWASYGKELE